MSLKELGLTNQQLASMSRDKLQTLPQVKARLTEAKAQLSHYQDALSRAYKDKLKLMTHAIVCLDMSKLVWLSA